ncbi:hypothetical protein K503DRAFT_416446 [Rhizopogon vinicolor AM-OR11-026]|uniref:Uncharacterized protein n=1 Tax=Rhizopogon vinicolor AM-OR11-026 TaxID=1314800 RepID=A0A1B7MQG7_9AGAM|nr:hypothetical protein K503DRAFT_416446 [Rhizopogon vinicolor AM-OR11-026]
MLNIAVCHYQKRTRRTTSCIRRDSVKKYKSHRRIRVTAEVLACVSNTVGVQNNPHRAIVSFLFMGNAQASWGFKGCFLTMYQILATKILNF